MAFNYAPNNSLPQRQPQQHGAGNSYGHLSSYQPGHNNSFQGVPQQHVPVHLYNHNTGNHHSHAVSSQCAQQQHGLVQPYNPFSGYQQNNNPLIQGMPNQGVPYQGVPHQSLAGQPCTHHMGTQQSHTSSSQGMPQQHVAVNICNRGMDLLQGPVFDVGHHPIVRPANEYAGTQSSFYQPQTYRPNPVYGIPTGPTSFAGMNAVGGYQGIPMWPSNQTRPEKTVGPSRKRGVSEMSGSAQFGAHQKAVKSQKSRRKPDESAYRDAISLDESFYNKSSEQIQDVKAVILESNESSEQVNDDEATLAYNPGSEQVDSNDFALNIDSSGGNTEKLNEGARLSRTQLPYLGVLPDVQSGFSPLTKHHLTAKWHKWSQKRQENIAWREIIYSDGTVDMIQRHLAVMRTRCILASHHLDMTQPLAHLVLSKHMAFALLWYLEKCGVDSCDSYLGKLVAKYSRDLILKPLILCFKRLDSDAERGFLLLQKSDDQPELGTIEERLATVLRRIKEQHVPPFTKLEESYEEWRQFRRMYFGDGQEVLGGQTSEGGGFNQEGVRSREDVPLPDNDQSQEGASFDAATWTKDELYD